MSWIPELAGGEAPPKYVDTSSDKVPDPVIPNRMVSNKSANQPFLAYKEYRAKQDTLHAAWLEKKKARDEKIAKGEKVEPLEPDPTAPEEVTLKGLFKFIVISLICIALAGKFFAGSYTWDYQSKWLRLKTYWPTNQRLFSERALADFNGENGKPLYLAIDGDVYDVSKGKAYQPGGSYHHFVGIDAARAFGTGCFQTHRTHDTRGMSESELRGLTHWKQFYVEHKDYVKVGRVNHPPIDPASPIPEHCDPKKAKAAKEAEEKLSKTDHQEL
ncbi:cytochrome b5-like heme/steroid binding domain-containing protein [Gymnopilus junonius]|uniref:Cytochrome b5-like heme/steroid binding domain-containing protein n=1 Tax=Gymnopilus junonius TaxID=109634 RepID=A0A9P5TUF7_GYMJU|nr:cytochrome b5-like heme/steroid binding domain-containing protein [Gymnopilus junonius]